MATELGAATRASPDLLRSTMLEMTLAEVDSATRDRATTEWNGQRYEARSRHGATVKLSRTLVGQTYSPLYARKA